MEWGSEMQVLGHSSAWHTHKKIGFKFYINGKEGSVHWTTFPPRNIKIVIPRKNP